MSEYVYFWGLRYYVVGRLPVRKCWLFGEITDYEYQIAPVMGGTLEIVREGDIDVDWRDETKLGVML